MNKYNYWQENKMKIVNYLANGHSKSELINFLGISKSTFYKWTKRNFKLRSNITMNFEKTKFTKFDFFDFVFLNN